MGLMVIRRRHCLLTCVGERLSTDCHRLSDPCHRLPRPAISCHLVTAFSGESLAAAERRVNDTSPRCFPMPPAKRELWLSRLMKFTRMTSTNADPALEKDVENPQSSATGRHIQVSNPRRVVSSAEISNPENEAPGSSWTAVLGTDGGELAANGEFPFHGHWATERGNQWAEWRQPAAVGDRDWAWEDELAATLPKLVMRAFLGHTGERDSFVTTYDDHQSGNYRRNTYTISDGTGVRGEERLRNHDKKRQMKKTLDSRQFLAEPFKSARCSPLSRPRADYKRSVAENLSKRHSLRLVVAWWKSDLNHRASPF